MYYTEPFAQPCPMYLFPQGCYPTGRETYPLLCPLCPSSQLKACVIRQQWPQSWYSACLLGALLCWAAPSPLLRGCVVCSLAGSLSHSLFLFTPSPSQTAASVFPPAVPQAGSHASVFLMAIYLSIVQSAYLGRNFIFIHVSSEPPVS